MISGRVWKFGDDISTDLILPGPVVKAPMSVQLRHVFTANRPGWLDQVGAGDLLVAGRNFGMGSARPAASTLRELKIGFLVADEINSLFFRNCINLGFLALECPGVSSAFEEGDIAELELESWTLRNRRTDRRLTPLPIPERFLSMMRNGGIFPMLEAEGLIAPMKSDAHRGTISIQPAG